MRYTNFCIQLCIKTVYNCIQLYTVLYTNTVYFTVGVQAIHCVVLTIAPVSHQLNTADDDDDDAE